MTEGRIDRNAAFTILSNRRRRQLLYLLVRCEGTRSLQTAAREIAGRLEGIDAGEITDGVYRSVYVSLYQSHAPQLAAEGIIDYDAAARTVRLAHNRRTETVLQLVGIETNGARDADPRTVRLLTGTVAAAALCGLLAGVDHVWIVPWAVLVAGILTFHVRRYAGTSRLSSVTDCGDLTADHDSPANVVDDGAHPDQRQEYGRAEREVSGQ